MSKYPPRQLSEKATGLFISLTHIRQSGVEIFRQPGGFASNSITSVSGAPSEDSFASVPVRQNPDRPRGVSFQNSDILTDLLDLTGPDQNEWFVSAQEFIEVLYQIVDSVPT